MLRTRTTGRPAILLAFLISLTATGGCAFVPTPVRLLDKPSGSEKSADKNVKVFVVVWDERPQSIQKSNMCGIMRNLYMVPTSFAFLAHREHLDEILAHHIGQRLREAGYQVVGSYPQAADALSAEEIRARDLDSQARNEAWWKDAGSQADSEFKKKGLTGGVEPLDELSLSVWGEEVDPSGADAVVEIKIRKFWSDMGWAIDVTGVFAWMSANFAVCDADDPARKVVFGKKVRGFGHGRGVTPLEAYGVPINAAYWFVLHETEKVIASEEFRQAIGGLADARAARL